VLESVRFGRVADGRLGTNHVAVQGNRGSGRPPSRHRSRVVNGSDGPMTARWGGGPSRRHPHLGACPDDRPIPSTPLRPRPWPGTLPFPG